MNKVILRIALVFVVSVQTLFADITYYFADNPALQGAVRGRGGFSFSGWSITTDGTKGFLSAANILDIHIDEYGSVIEYTTLTLNNLFATESHLGFANPLVGRFSDYYINGTDASSTYLDWQSNRQSNQNFSIDIDQFVKINYALQLTSLTGKATPYGQYPNGVIPVVSWLPPYPSMDYWYSMSYSADNLFSNYGATDASGDYSIGLGIDGFSISGTLDEEHMRDEMIADGFSELARPTREGYQSLTAPMVIASSVPEPSAISLLVFGGVVVALGRREK
jgi:hypothetical protein